MCELFAVSAKEPLTANIALEEFYRHSVQHPHGWGLAWRDDDGIHMCKEPLPAYESSLLKRVLSQPVRARHILGHIRKATHGRPAYENCHPFVQADSQDTEWVMIHNGVIVNDDLLAGYDSWTSGQTDSECVLMFLLDVLEEAARRRHGELGFDERFEALASAVRQLSNGNKLNLIIDDGEYLYVHTNTLDTTLYAKPGRESVVLSTTPLDGDEWKPVPQRRLIAFKDGQVVRASMLHMHAFDSSTVRYLTFNANR